MYFAPGSDSPTAAVSAASSPRWNEGGTEPLVRASPADCPARVPVCLVFTSGQTAAQRVLGIPALALALREVALAGWSKCTLVVPGKWRACGTVAQEVMRLAPGLQLELAEALPRGAPMLIVQGEELAGHRDLRDRAHAILRASPMATAIHAGGQELLRTAERKLRLATAKPGDGIVARHLNRPLSQVLSQLLLRWLGPVHPTVATIGTALIGVAMLLGLLLMPGHSGLLLGALLFQCASIFDGVDGELARATFRVTPLGGTLDSLVDGATNLLFFGGVICNLHLQGDHFSAGLALLAMAGLALGTALLGWRARRESGAIDFNAVKRIVLRERSPMMQLLTWLTMRDLRARGTVADRLRAGRAGSLGLCGGGHRVAERSGRIACPDAPHPYRLKRRLQTPQQSHRLRAR